MRYVTLGDTFDVKLTTRRFSSGAPFTLAGSPSIAAYVGNTTTPVTAGITLTVDFNSVTGFNNVRVVASGGNGYAAGNWALMIAAGTVDSVSVVGEVIENFVIGAVPAAVTSIAAGAITAASIATGAIDADALATDAVNEIADGVWDEASAGHLGAGSTGEALSNAGSAGTPPTAIEIADALLDRDMATGTDSGSPTVRTVRQALRFLRNKWSVTGTTLTVTKEDDATASWTAELTTSGSAQAVTASDPAGP